MSIGSKFGLSDSLLDAVKGVTDSNKPISTNIDVYNGLAEKMSSKEKMAKGLYNAKHLDKVDPKELKGKHADRKDKDIDNDGDVDSTDKYLHKRRKAITKNVKNGNGKMNGKQDEVDVNPTMDDVKESAGSRSIDKTGGEMNAIPQGSSKTHDCAKQVTHEQWGDGVCMYAEHAEPDENGHVSWYDVMFEHGIERKVPVADMTVVTEGSHGNHKKKKDK